MSGGSYDYAYSKVEDMAERLLDQTRYPLRVAFGRHLKKVAKAMHDIEWVDSCDYGTGDEVKAINACLSDGAELEVAIELAEQTKQDLEKVIQEAKAVRGEG